MNVGVFVNYLYFMSTSVTSVIKKQQKRYLEQKGFPPSTAVTVLAYISGGTLTWRFFEEGLVLHHVSDFQYSFICLSSMALRCVG